MAKGNITKDACWPYRKEKESDIVIISSNPLSFNYMTEKNIAP